MPIRRGLLLSALALLVLPASASGALLKHVALSGGAKTATVRWSVPRGQYVVGTAFPGNTFWPRDRRSAAGADFVPAACVRNRG